MPFWWEKESSSKNNKNIFLPTFERWCIHLYKKINYTLRDLHPGHQLIWHIGHRDRSIWGNKDYSEQLNTSRKQPGNIYHPEDQSIKKAKPLTWWPDGLRRTHSVGLGKARLLRTLSAHLWLWQPGLSLFLQLLLDLIDLLSQKVVILILITRF